MSKKTPVNIVWAAGKDAYHLQRSRDHYPTSDYFQALVQVIQEDHPSLSYAEAMREAVAIDSYTVGVLSSQQVGRRIHDRLMAQERMRHNATPSIMPA
jgi:hypothetical protein